MKKTAILICLLLVAFLILIANTSLPLGLPKEWVWLRRPGISGHCWMNYLIGAVGFAFAAALAFLCDKEAKKPRERLCIFVLLCALGVWFDFNTFTSGSASSYESVMAVIESYTSGYLSEAEKISNSLQYLRGFHHKIELDAEKTNHLDVHPPGNTIFSRAVLCLSRRGLLPSTLPRLLLSQYQPL